MQLFSRIAFFLLLVGLFLEIWLGFPKLLELKKEEPPAPAVSEAVHGPDRKMQGVHLVESQAGNRDWELFAESAVGAEGQGSWELKNVKVHFFSESGVQFTVTGREGRIDTKSKDMEIRGDVVTRSTNGYEFQSSSVTFLSQKRILSSPDHVRMIGPKDQQGRSLILEGRIMETQVDNSLMKIQDSVKASKELSKGRQFVIHSKRAEFSGQSNSARFIDQVSIELESMKMEGPEAQFVYKPGSDFLSSIEVKGGVRVSDFDKYATSDNVRFDPIDNRYTLTGNPRVVQNNDEIFGEEIVLVDGGRKVRVEKMKARVEREKEFH